MKNKNVCEICKCELPLLEHHIQSICYEGENKPFNKCRICSNCHTFVHIGDIILEGRFNSTKGNILVYRNRGEMSITGTEDPQVWIW